jgi:hypothetical protein
MLRYTYIACLVIVLILLLKNEKQYTCFEQCLYYLRQQIQLTFNDFYNTQNTVTEL